jgi:hypothetical protein
LPRVEGRKERRSALFFYQARKNLSKSLEKHFEKLAGIGKTNLAQKKQPSIIAVRKIQFFMLKSEY